MIKLIASDMDGTLLNSNHEIHEENIRGYKKGTRNRSKNCNFYRKNV